MLFYILSCLESKIFQNFQILPYHCLEVYTLHYIKHFVSSLWSFSVESHSISLQSMERSVRGLTQTYLRRNVLNSPLFQIFVRDVIEYDFLSEN